jgi:hypothetical protein
VRSERGINDDDDDDDDDNNNIKTFFIYSFTILDNNMKMNSSGDEHFTVENFYVKGSLAIV